MPCQALPEGSPRGVSCLHFQPTPETTETNPAGRVTGAGRGMPVNISWNNERQGDMDRPQITSAFRAWRGLGWVDHSINPESTTAGGSGWASQSR